MALAPSKHGLERGLAQRPATTHLGGREGTASIAPSNRPFQVGATKPGGEEPGIKGVTGARGVHGAHRESRQAYQFAAACRHGPGGPAFDHDERHLEGEPRQGSLGRDRPGYGLGFHFVGEKDVQPGQQIRYLPAFVRIVTGVGGGAEAMRARLGQEMRHGAADSRLEEVG